MISMINPNGKGEVIDGATSSFKPCKQTCPDVTRDLKLDRASGFLLDDHGTGSDILACDEGSNLNLSQIAASELTVDCEIKQRSVSHAPLPI
ncbi:hypothetical protein J2Y48_004247 [Mycoplana sp. BE70]|nr:hypothetical protein [Mycoplana sp. BE70]